MNLQLVNTTPPPSNTERLIADHDLVPAMVGDELGIATGPAGGIAAIVEVDTNRVVHLYRFNGELPPRSRESANQAIVYGEPVRLGGKWDGSQRINQLNENQYRIWKEHLYS